MTVTEDYSFLKEDLFFTEINKFSENSISNPVTVDINLFDEIIKNEISISEHIEFREPGYELFAAFVGE